jgi:tetratricopeptide (TPR) repeat protein
MTPQRTADDDSPFDLEGAIFLIAAAVARGDSYTTFAASFLTNTDRLMPAPAHGNLREDPGLRRRVAIALVRALWRQMPDPTHRYAPAPLPNPERNAPCHCGSGLKYKKCCEPIERGVPIERMNLLPHLLEALPKKRWAELVGSRIALEMVGVTAHEWSGERKDEEALTLLEPWFADDAHLDGRHELMFDTLLEVYTHLGSPRKKAALLDRALVHGDPAIRSAAIQRQICMHADQGDYDAAWKLFGEAQRADPDSPSLSHLEVTMLISEGREAEARERAQFWGMRLKRRRDPELVELIDFLDNIANHGSGAMLDLAADMEPTVGELMEAFRQAPPLVSAYTLAPQDDSAGPLNATAELTEALADWEETFPSPCDLEFPEDAEAEIWASAPAWLALLEQRPILWQSFEVLDSLIQAVHTIPIPGTENLAIDLLDRAERLLREVIRENSAEGLKLEWGWLENRTALSLIGERITIDRDQSPSAENLARMEWLVRTLNPNDNQGFRTRLLRHYLELGRYDEALAFAELYPDDFAAMQYTRALALFALNRIDDATLALKSAIAQYPKLLTWLLKPRPKPPRSDGFGIAVGGDEEAWIYRHDHLSLWQDLGAIEWAGLVNRSSKR